MEARCLITSQERRFEAMKRSLFCLLVLLTLLSDLLVATTRVAHAASSSCVNPNGTNVLRGALGGANYTISVPSNWNGTLVLYSHGYVFPNQPLLNPAPDIGDPLTGAALLQQGYALAGSSYSQNGWAIQQAFHDQIALLDFFDATCGTPTRTIAAGISEGGLISAGLVQLYPDRFAGALPVCGAVAGGIGDWNEGLDSAFAFKVLLAGNAPLSIVHITDPTSSFNLAQQILAQAQSSAQGRARLALAAALSDIPGWFDPASPEPASTDYTTQEQNQVPWISHDFNFAFFGRADLEFRAGGNPSWNDGVDYTTQLAHSADRNEVIALYQQAGLDLTQDLATLNNTPRITADPQAVQYLNSYITLNGALSVPVLTMHTAADGIEVNQNEQAYASVVQSSGDTSLLREVFVHRAGHCTITPAEALTAFQTLIGRLDTGTWEDSTNPDLMNQEATALGPNLNVLPEPFPTGTLTPTPPAFLNFQPALFLRPFPSNGSQ
jgi:pimeloyl-ACP methyl ester carboxylesterase